MPRRCRRPRSRRRRPAASPPPPALPRRSSSPAAATPWSGRRSASAAPSSHASPATAVVVQYLDPTTEKWTRQARTTVREDGTFVARWKPKRVGQFRTRALVGGEAQAASASPELALNVFRPAIATWYGPGFYGNTTACGIELTEETIGIAHRSLPCGTNVAVRYGPTTVVVPVIDRGPFSGEAKWDLTYAAAQTLGFTYTDRIGAIRLAPAPAQPASK